MLWGLSYGGEEGARAVLEVFRKEIDVTFALTGTIKATFMKFQYYHGQFYKYLEINLQAVLVFKTLRKTWFNTNLTTAICSRKTRRKIDLQ